MKHLDETDVVLAVERAMTEAERGQFLQRFLQPNPHYRGAHVADVLAILDDSDSNLEVTEPMYEEHIPEADRAPRLFNVCTLAVLYSYGNATWTQVADLIERATEQLRNPGSVYLCGKEAVEEYLEGYDQAG